MPEELEMSKPIYLPFADGQWRLAMGLKPLQLQDWIEIDADFADQLTLKTQLLAQRYSDVFANASAKAKRSLPVASCRARRRRRSLF